MLSGNNGVLQRATDAKQTSERAEAKEQARIDIMAWIMDKVSKNENSNLDDVKIQEILTGKLYVKEAKATSFITAKGEYDIPYSELYNATDSQNVEPGTTLGENYSDSWIGKTIDYKSEKNNVNEWIILGKQVNNQGKNDVLITTKNPVSSTTIEKSFESWVDYINTIKTACSTFVGETGTLGTKIANVKEVRSITLDDINNAVGFTVPETFDEFTFGSIKNIEEYKVDYYYPDETNKTWINPTTSGTTWKHKNDSYSYEKNGQVFKYTSPKNPYNAIEIQPTNLDKINNCTYIQGDGQSFWIASRAIKISEYCAYYCCAESIGTGNGPKVWFR